MNVCVFCSAAKLEDKYTKPAIELAYQIGKRGHTFVWGGSKSGLMTQVADAARKGGGKLVGVSLERFNGVVYQDADEMLIAKTLGERKALMLERSDVVIALVGGLGTLDELTEVLELKKHGAHDKPIIILNTDNFYEGLKIQLQKMQDDRFLPVHFNDLVIFTDTPEEAIAYLE